jgi:uncharacterized protein (DUF983 family)
METRRMRWEPDRAVTAIPSQPASLWQGLARGAANHCPVCGQGKVFRGYLSVVPECSHCGTALGALRADDAPPYFTIFVAGHLLVPLALWVEKAYQPPLWLHMAVWLPLFTLACLVLLRPIKGAVVAWMLRLGITGTEQGFTAPPARRDDG